MGITGLMDFIKRFEGDLIRKIDMRHEIEKWKRNNDGNVPTIVIDLKDISYLVHRDEIGSIFGGQYVLYKHILRKLCQNLKQMGVKLVFFMVGKRYTDDLSLFVPKTEFRHNNSMEILDRMRDQTEMKSLMKMQSLKYSGRDSYALSYNFSKILRYFGDFCVTYVEHHREIAQYLNQHSGEVLALISNDTNFLAFEGGFELWLIPDISIRYMTCRKVEKEKLYARLGFNYGAQQMKLFSALSGTAYLPMDLVINFIRELNNNRQDPRKIGKIWCISEYVGQQSIEVIDNQPQFDLDKISGDVFGTDYTPMQRDAIAKGLAICNMEFDDDELEFQDKYKENKFLSFCKEREPFLFKLATDDVYVVKDYSFIDYQNYRSKTYAELIIPMLMKMSGILFQNDPNRREVRQIVMKHAHDEPFKLTEETVIYPPMPLPDLHDLIVKNRDDTFNELRWSLFKWVHDCDDEFYEKIKGNTEFRNLSAVIITLQFLLQQGELTPLEANVILYTEKEVRNINIWGDLHPEYGNAEFVRIAHLYVKMYVLVSHSLDACGLHELTDFIRFDGPLFHKNMTKFQEATDEEMDALHAAIEPVWIFS